MEGNVIYHGARHLQYTLARQLEIEPDCPQCPRDQPTLLARCPDCECTMVYRGVARLRSGTLVHHFECIHSHREVHSLSIVIPD